MRGSPHQPPGDFDHRVLPIIQTKGTFYRCAAICRPLLDWDTRDTSRFSGPTLPFPVLYLAEDKITGFWECFGDELNDQPQDQKALSLARDLEPRQWVSYKIRPSLKVVDVTEPDTMRAIGADGATFLSEYSITQAWSKALMLHPSELDGFYYRSRLDSNQRCLALFGREHLRVPGPRITSKAEGLIVEDLDLLMFLVKESICLL